MPNKLMNSDGDIDLSAARLAYETGEITYEQYQRIRKMATSFPEAEKWIEDNVSKKEQSEWNKRLDQKHSGLSPKTTMAVGGLLGGIGLGAAYGSASGVPFGLVGAVPGAIIGGLIGGIGFYALGGYREQMDAKEAEIRQAYAEERVDLGYLTDFETSKFYASKGLPTDTRILPGGQGKGTDYAGAKPRTIKPQYIQAPSTSQPAETPVGTGSRTRMPTIPEAPTNPLPSVIFENGTARLKDK